MFAVIVLFLFFIPLLKAGYYVPRPPKGAVVVCFDLVCFKEAIELSISNDMMLLGMVVRKVADEPYIPLFVGWIMDLFSHSKREPLLALFDAKIWEDANAQYGSVRLLATIPPNSVFISMEHGLSSFGIRNLDYVHSIDALEVAALDPEHVLVKTVPDVILHLNHEQPWITSDPSHIDFTFDSTEELAEAYSRYPLVLRNYYYSPLEETTHYFPIGPSYYGHVIGNDSSSTYAQRKRWSSQREYFCFFSGRFAYVVYDETVEQPAHYKQRMQLKELRDQGKLSNCVIESEVADELGDTYKKLTYDEYTLRMTQTVFAPCPPGNTPETFRIYEALELGAIPLLIRPPSDELDFLQTDLWRDYPGPVFTNWDPDMPLFLEKMADDPTAVDLLQARVVTWYAEFKERTRDQIAALLEEAFASKTNKSKRSPLAPSPSSTPPSTTTTTTATTIPSEETHKSSSKREKLVTLKSDVHLFAASTDLPSMPGDKESAAKRVDKGKDQDVLARRVAALEMGLKRSQYREAELEKRVLELEKHVEALLLHPIAA